MKEAEWMPSPHVERETATLSRRSRWEGRLGVWFAGLTSVGALVSGVTLLSAIGTGASPWVCVFSGASLLALIALTLWLAARDNDLVARVRRRDQARREEFGARSGWIVDLIVLQGAAPTGADRGMLWIEGDRLCFSGDRTSFALSSDQLAGRCRGVLPVAGMRHATCLPLRLRTVAGPLALSFRTGENEASLVRYAIDRWSFSRSTGGQLPPLRIGPGAIPASRLLLTAAFGTAYWTVAAILVGSSFSFTRIDFGSLMLGLLLVLGGFLLRLPLALRWRAFRDLRRLERR